MLSRFRPFLGPILISAALALAVGCSLLVDFSECESDADCATNFGASSVCADGVCSGAAVNGEKLGGPCQQAFGPQNDDDFWVGILLPLTGDEGGFGRPLLDAILLALNDITAIEGVNGQPVSLVVCDTLGLDETALAGARHLANVGVTAIVGPDFSRQTIQIAEEVTIQNEIVLMTPSGTALEIANLDDNNLVWRTVANDLIQGLVLRLLLERVVTKEKALAWADANVLILAQDGDPYTEGLAEVVVSDPPAGTTESSYKYATYTTNWEEWWINNRADFDAPDVVVLIGAAESWDFAEEIDLFFNNNTIYLFADAAKNTEEAGKTSASLEGRILGTAPANVGSVDYPPYQIFRAKFRSEYDVDPNQFQFVANAFDALFVITLGATVGTDGPSIAQGLSRLSDVNGELVSADQAGARRAIAVLGEGGSVNYQGASGPLDFNAAGEPATGDIALWCFRDGGVPEEGLLYQGGDTIFDVNCDETVTNNSVPDMGADMGDDMGADLGPDM